MELDQSVYFAAVRQALANKNAAVMIGAGFSLNATNGHLLKTWSGLADDLWSALNPGVAPGANHAPVLMATQLAEQYCRVHSRAALDTYLSQALPDDKVSPGALHEQLLRLNWSEIFTTNYDTLLERASENIVEIAHFTVTGREDIPQSRILGRRRIVKLHGSFPSNRPFILTEEDYRTYPQRFAPFVNLVRQSLLENVFCLIGFSGDDPNFIHWIGWVRDMLDNHALPIYLFVFDKPSLGTQKLLEMRGVTPVVLPLPGKDYRTRISELLRILALPLDQSPDTWGELDRPEQIPYLEERSEERFQRWIKAWPQLSKARASYPGWLVAPRVVRQRLQRSLQNPIFSYMVANTLTDRLAQEHSVIAIACAREHIWTQTVLVLPTDDSWGELLERILPLTGQLEYGDITDVLKQRLKQFGIQSSSDWIDCWLACAIGALHWLRQRLNIDAFNHLKAIIEPKLDGHERSKDEMNYATVLLHLYRGERVDAITYLNQWQPEPSNAYARVRKGALQAELGYQNEGLANCLEAIRALRAAQRANQDGVAQISEEAWACKIAHDIHQSEWRRTDDEYERSSRDLTQRLVDLAGQGYDVYAELKEVLTALGAEAQPPGEYLIEGQEFDLGHISSSRVLGATSEFRQKVEGALRWLTLAEQAGLTPRVGQLSVDIDAYAQAAWWSQYADSPERMLSVVMRTLKQDFLKPKSPNHPPHKTGWLSRYQVARLPLHIVRDVANRSLAQVERLLESNLTEIDASHVCSFYLEVFSRLVIRLNDDAVAYLQRVINLIAHGHFTSRHEVWEHLANAIYRCVEATPPANRHLLVALLIRLPIAPENHHPGYSHRWPFLPETLEYFKKNPVDTERNEAISRLVSQLIYQLHAPDLANNQSTHRSIWGHLIWLAQLNLLSRSERAELAALIWSIDGSWPTIPEGFSPILALDFTPLDVGDTQAKFVQHLLKIGIPKMGSENGWLLNPDNSWLENIRRSIREHAWSIEELELFLGTLRDWWDDEGERILVSLGRLSEIRSLLLHRLMLIDSCLASLIFKFRGLISFQSRSWSWINSWIADLSPVAPLWGVRLAQSIGDTLASKAIDKEMASALLGSEGRYPSAWVYRTIYLWTTSETLKGAPAPNLTLLAATTAICVRENPRLVYALWIARLAVEAGGVWLDALSPTQLEAGLEGLLRELSYDRTARTPVIPNEDVPVLRFHCASLALAVSGTELSQAVPSAEEWVRQLERDPLPEVRFLEQPEEMQVAPA